MMCIGAMMGAAITPSAAAPQPLSPAEARAIAKDAYIYGFPLVSNYRIQHAYFVDRDNPEFKASWNTLVNNATVPTPDDDTVRTPNLDTPYSFVGADLRAEPLVFTVPQVDKRRYYSLQFIDQYTFNFAYVGSRVTGNGAASYLLAGPDWKGTAPKGITVIRSETQFVFVLYRTQLFDPADIENVKTVQAGYKVQTLSEFLGQPAPPAAPTVDFIKPLTAEEERASPEFFQVLNFILQFCPTHPAEKAMMARFARIGVGAGKPFDVQALSPQMRDAIAGGIADAWTTVRKYKQTQLDTGKKSSVDAFGTRKFMNGRYLERFAAAVLGIYGNSKDEAIYPAYFTDSAGQRLIGKERYTLHFAPSELPPANAFWSLTMYELPSTLLSANPLHRYLINSAMLPGLKRDADGGITLYVQNESPGEEKEANWLPAPSGSFFAVLRLYWPQASALNGKWSAPPLIAFSAPPSPSAANSPIEVTVDNFVRAESDLRMSALVNDGGFGKFIHRRKPASIDQQTAIGLNRDMLYSAAVFDLNAGPVTITLPAAGKRFMSMQVISEDHYVPMVVYRAGAYTLNKAKVGTRYVLAAVRMLFDPADPKDVEQVHALQDAIKVQQKSTGRFEVPQWDQVSQKKVRDELVARAATFPNLAKAFGAKAQVDPVQHLIGTAVGWGGIPNKEAVYLNFTPNRNDGNTDYELNVKNVPVDGFWSISVYNAEGHFQKNESDAYTLNSVTAKRGSDGSITIHFGGCYSEVVNCIPIVAGWNYIVRLYRPRAEILSGSWRFPKSRPVN
jgi:hypothetical protein